MVATRRTTRQYILVPALFLNTGENRGATALRDSRTCILLRTGLVHLQEFYQEFYQAFNQEFCQELCILREFYTNPVRAPKEFARMPRLLRHASVRGCLPPRSLDIV